MGPFTRVPKNLNCSFNTKTRFKPNFTQTPLDRRVICFNPITRHKYFFFLKDFEKSNILGKTVIISPNLKVPFTLYVIISVVTNELIHELIREQIREFLKFVSANF